jgi:transposase
VLVELSVMEQQYQAVLAVVQDGWKVVEVARRLGVSRQSVHAWNRPHEQGGLGSLADRSHRPASCPHQTPAEVEGLICELRRLHSGWDLAGSSISPPRPAPTRFRLARPSTGALGLSQRSSRQ